MQTAIAEKPVVRPEQKWPDRQSIETKSDNTMPVARFTRVTRDANTVSVVVSDTPIPRQRVEVTTTLFGEEWSLPEIVPVKKRTRGRYAKKIDPEEIEAWKVQMLQQRGLRLWDSDEVEELHEILLNETNREMREAIEEGDTASIREKLTWYEDMTWRPLSFPVCCAIVGADPKEVLRGIHQGLADYSIMLH